MLEVVAEAAPLSQEASALGETQWVARKWGPLGPRFCVAVACTADSVWECQSASSIGVSSEDWNWGCESRHRKQ